MIAGALNARIYIIHVIAQSSIVQNWQMAIQTPYPVGLKQGCVLF